MGYYNLTNIIVATTRGSNAGYDLLSIRGVTTSLNPRISRGLLLLDDYIEGQNDYLNRVKLIVARVIRFESEV